MSLRIFSARLLELVLIFFGSLGSIGFLIIFADDEKGSIIIKNNLQLYYGAIGFFILLGMASIMILWIAYKNWREERDLLKRYRKNNNQ
jgi:hypothetical protein